MAWELLSNHHQSHNAVSKIVYIVYGIQHPYLTNMEWIERLFT